MKLTPENEKDLSPFYHRTGPYNCRIQEVEMSQNLIAPAAWMLAIMKLRPAMVIEIGTCKGGLSNLLSSCTAQYGGEFHTMDVRTGGQENQYPLYGNATFHHWNCFEHIKEIEALIQKPGLCFLLCDGGDKPKEFNTFAPFLKTGDVIAAHDFCDETIPNFSPEFWGCFETPIDRIMETITKFRLTLFYPEWFTYSAWCVRRRHS